MFVSCKPGPRYVGLSMTYTYPSSSHKQGEPNVGRPCLLCCQEIVPRTHNGWRRIIRTGDSRFLHFHPHNNNHRRNCTTVAKTPPSLQRVQRQYHSVLLSPVNLFSFTTGENIVTLRCILFVYFFPGYFALATAESSSASSRTQTYLIPEIYCFFAFPVFLHLEAHYLRLYFHFLFFRIARNTQCAHISAVHKLLRSQSP